MNSNSNESLTQRLQKVNSNKASKLLENMQGFGNLGHIHSLVTSSGSLLLDNLDYNDQMEETKVEKVSYQQLKAISCQ
ncbi:hypothetical protein [Wolbachia endosymbiont of Mansonella perstans]|uniref:hypothetical protein n=1 Tax=Wolbachia endosymbiont of Mansonella perstans TaxID=229526 RepID=UPI001CE02FC1|nr:hypothetical protein [Wolbachia endosymbiont of Mansonella perstans]MCA4773726.1 hypothetical protein [Wolbachia endosymbiont of Mansonella perstans]